MARVLSVAAERFPIAGTFTISRGSKTEAEVITCTISEDGSTGRGECVPYRRYGETMDSVRAADRSVRAADRARHRPRRPARRRCRRVRPATRSTARCGISRPSCRAAASRAASARRPPRPLETAYTLSLGSRRRWRRRRAPTPRRPLLKVKIGGEGDIARIRAVREAAPDSRIILDANEGWTDDNIGENLAVAAELGIALIEQPLPAGRDAILRHIAHPVPICADESVHDGRRPRRARRPLRRRQHQARQGRRADRGAALRDRARELGFSIMVGCMVGTSLAMAPAVLLAQGADFVDLDGPLLLARDRDAGLVYEGRWCHRREPALWG